MATYWTCRIKCSSVSANSDCTPVLQSEGLDRVRFLAKWQLANFLCSFSFFIYNFVLLNLLHQLPFFKSNCMSWLKLINKHDFTHTHTHSHRQIISSHTDTSNHSASSLTQLGLRQVTWVCRGNYGPTHWQRLWVNDARSSKIKSAKHLTESIPQNNCEKDVPNHSVGSLANVAQSLVSWSDIEGLSPYDFAIFGLCSSFSSHVRFLNVSDFRREWKILHSFCV